MEREKDYTWVKISEPLEDPVSILKGAEITAVTVNKTLICLSEWEGRLHAFQSRCPHASGFLKEGWISSKGEVVCPVHQYKFCVKNGRNTTGEGYHLKTYPVKTTPEGIFVGFRKKGLFSWL